MRMGSQFRTRERYERNVTPSGTLRVPFSKSTTLECIKDKEVSIWVIVMEFRVSTMISMDGSVYMDGVDENTNIVSGRRYNRCR